MADDLLSFSFEWRQLLEPIRVGSGLKYIFHWKAQLLILAKSLFSSFADVFVMCNRKQGYVSSK